MIMMDFELTLCSLKLDAFGFHVWAEMKKGILTVNIQDVDGGFASLFGDKAYNYSLTFDEPNSIRLLKLIGGIKEPISALEKRFGGLKGCQKLTEICKANSIEYNLFSCSTPKETNYI